MNAKAQFVVAAFPWWGHIRHALQLSLNLLSIHPSLCITFITVQEQLEHIRNEMSASDASSDVLDRLRIVVIPMSVEAATGKEATFLYAAEVDEDLEKGLDDALKSLIRGSPIACAVSGTLHDWKVEIRLVFTDMCLPKLQSSLTRTIASTPHTIDIPLLVANPMPGHWYLDLWAPEGRFQLLRKIIETTSAETGLSADDVLKNMPVPKPDDRVLKLAGLPDIYAYETRCQTEAIPQNPPRGLAYAARVAGVIDTSSGVLLAIPAELSEGCGPLIAADGRECIEVGPQFSDSFWQGKMASWKQEDAALKAFLDKHEERTVIYVSFGSLFWPIGRLDLVVDLIETLLECKFPFVLGTMPPGSGVDDLITTIETSGIGMVVSRSPQLALLQHSSVGFCLTHGGISSFFECLLTETLMVMFPLEGDQPLNALFASDKGVAIELMQVRTGMTVGLPTMRGTTPIDDKATRRDEMRDVWRSIRAKKGLEMLERVKAMKKVVVDSRNRGESYKAMRKFDQWIAKTT